MADNILVIKSSYKPHFTMKLNLQELFLKEDYKYEKDELPDPDIIHYTRWGRVKKILKILREYRWENEEAVKQLEEWLQEQIPLAKERKDKKSVSLMEKALKEVQDGKV